MKSNIPVSIIMPIRNEADFIARSLGSVLNQDYPREYLEILVVDGISDDGTRDIVARVIQEHPSHRIYLLDNPKHIVPSALNIGIRQATGDIIVRVDGHCEIPTNYVSRCVELLEETGADNVGGVLETVSNSVVGKAIALATSSYFGVGGSKFRCTKNAGWVDTVFPGVFRKGIFQRIGGFDEELVRNQDDEFNFRLVQAGGKIWLDPSIKVQYYSRSNFGKLWKQYFQYGFYKVRVMQKRKGVASWRHLVPGAFVLGLGTSGIFSLASGNPMWFLGIVGPYAMANAIASIHTAKPHWQFLPSLTLAFATLHLSYGLGFLWGLWRWRDKWGIS